MPQLAHVFQAQLMVAENDPRAPLLSLEGSRTTVSYPGGLPSGVLELLALTQES